MLIELRGQEVLELKHHWLSCEVEAAVCGSEGEIGGFIHVPSLWSEVGTGVASYHVAWV